MLMHTVLRDAAPLKQNSRLLWASAIFAVKLVHRLLTHLEHVCSTQELFEGTRQKDSAVLHPRNSQGPCR